MATRRFTLDDLEFRVEAWDDGGQHVDYMVAACNNVVVGRAAFEEAVRLYPEAQLTLRIGARVVEEWPRRS